MEKLLRKIQYTVVVLMILAVAGGYFYSRSNAAQKINSSQETKLTDGLVGYWTMDGNNISGSSLADSSGNNNTGTINGAIPAIGKIGQGLKLDSVTDYISIADPGTSSLDISTGEVTVSAWIKLDSVNSMASVLFKGNNNFRLTLDNNGNCDDADGKYEINFLFMGLYSCSASDVIDQINKWYYITVTRSTTQGILYYIDGSLVGTALTLGSYSLTNNNNSTEIGNMNGNNPFLGTLDEVRIYNRALSPSEITELYQQGQTKINASQTTKLTSGLKLYYTLDGGDVNIGSPYTVSDRSGNNYNGTLSHVSSYRPTQAIGKIAQALDFNGTNAYINTNQTTNVQFLDSLSISAWIYRDTDTSIDQIASKYEPSLPCGWGFIVNKNTSGNTLNFFQNSMNITSANTISTGQWYHVAAVKDNQNSRATFYINNSQDPGGWQNYTPTTFTDATNYNALIGLRGDLAGLNQAFDGKIDEVRFYDRAITPSEVTELYQQGQTKINASQTDKLTNGLVSNWTFDGQNTTATTALDSASGYTGNFSGSPTPTIGKIGQGLSFDGASDYITVTNASSADLNITGPLAISVWIYPETLPSGSSRSIISKGCTMVSGFCLKLDNSGGDCYDLPNYAISMKYGAVDEGSLCSTENPFTLNQWQHVVYTTDAATKKYIYLNGVENASGTPSGPFTQDANSNDTLIGKLPGGAQFDGYMDDIRIYSRYLTPSEVTELYNLGR